MCSVPQHHNGPSIEVHPQHRQCLLLQLEYGESVVINTILLGTMIAVNHINVLKALQNAFMVQFDGVIVSNQISKEYLQAIHDRVMIVPDQYQETSFKRTDMCPKYKLLVDFVLHFFLGHVGNHDQVTPLKFQIMALVILSLPICWANQVTLLHDEAKQIECTMEGDAFVEVRLHLEKRLLRLIRRRKPSLSLPFSIIESGMMRMSSPTTSSQRISTSSRW